MIVLSENKGSFRVLSNSCTSTYCFITLTRSISVMSVYGDGSPHSQWCFTSVTELLKLHGECVCVCVCVCVLKKYIPFLKLRGFTLFFFFFSKMGWEVRGRYKREGTHVYPWLGWEVRERNKRKGTHVYPWPIHVDTWQKPTRYCKATIPQFKKF